MTVQLKRKKKTISKEFQEALDALSLDFEKLQPRVDRVFTVGREEGMSDKEIGKEVRKKMKGEYNRQTIWRVFENYPDAKQQQNHKKGNKMLPFDEKPKIDKYANYKEIIATKNKLLKEKDEQIKGLQRQLTEANKKIKQLETGLKNVKKPTKTQGTQAEKNDLFRAGLGYIARRGGDETK